MTGLTGYDIVPSSLESAQDMAFQDLMGSHWTQNVARVPQLAYPSELEVLSWGRPGPRLLDRDEQMSVSGCLQSQLCW